MVSKQRNWGELSLVCFPSPCATRRPQFCATLESDIQHVAHKREEILKLSRRHLAAAGALALVAPTLIRSAHAQSADEATVKKAVEELRTAWIKQDEAKLESLTAEQLSYSHSDARLA